MLCKVIMRFSLFLLSSIICFTSSFSPQLPLDLGSRRLASHKMSTEEVSYVISGNNIDITPSINDYVNKKLDKIIGKLSSSGFIQECDVHLNVNKNPKVKNGHTAEVVTYLKGTIIRCSEDTPDMYASIDAVTDRLAKKLIKYKERRLKGYHGGSNMGEYLAEVLEGVAEENGIQQSSTDDEFEDPEAPVVTEIKSYDLSKPISIQEAIFALDYVDHDFFVFREEASQDINVIYKRNVGGFGIIKPSQ